MLGFGLTNLTMKCKSVINICGHRLRKNLRIMMNTCCLLVGMKYLNDKNYLAVNLTKIGIMCLTRLIKIS